MLAHLCARLLESSAEIRSAILVQRSYRSYVQRTERARTGKKEAVRATEPAAMVCVCVCVKRQSLLRCFVCVYKAMMVLLASSCLRALRAPRCICFLHTNPVPTFFYLRRLLYRIRARTTRGFPH